MPDLVLTESEQAALRTLTGAEPVPGDALPSVELLECISRLIPSDDMMVCLTDATGCVLDQVCLPGLELDDFDPQVCDGPLPLGVVHQSRDPAHAELLAHVGVSDGLVIGFRSGRNHVVQLGFDRFHGTFSERDLAMLRLIAPSIARLVPERPRASLTSTLTTQERRVLQLLSTGMSNADIAAYLYVAPSTVRKHLEHAFRKLGVTNRLAAVIAFEGGLQPRADSGEKYA